MTLSWPDVDSLVLLPSDVCFFDVCLHLKKVPPPKIPIRQPVNYLRRRFSMTTDNKTCHRIKKFCWQSNPKSPGLLFWVFYFRRTEFSTTHNLCAANTMLYHRATGTVCRKQIPKSNKKRKISCRIVQFTNTK